MWCCLFVICSWTSFSGSSRSGFVSDYLVKLILGVTIYYYAISALVVCHELLTLQNLGNIFLWNTCRYSSIDSVTSQKIQILDNIRSHKMNEGLLFCTMPVMHVLSMLNWVRCYGQKIRFISLWNLKRNFPSFGLQKNKKPQLSGSWHQHRGLKHVAHRLHTSYQFMLYSSVTDFIPVTECWPSQSWRTVFVKKVYQHMSYG